MFALFLIILLIFYYKLVWNDLQQSLCSDMIVEDSLFHRSVEMYCTSLDTSAGKVMGIDFIR